MICVMRAGYIAQPGQISIILNHATLDQIVESDIQGHQHCNVGNEDDEKRKLEFGFGKSHLACRTEVPYNIRQMIFLNNLLCTGRSS